jgi:hypothetical protein
VNTNKLFDTAHRNKAILLLIVCLTLLAGAVVLAWWTQRDFGSVEVSNLAYENQNGIPIRAKLLRPTEASAEPAGCRLYSRVPEQS